MDSNSTFNQVLEFLEVDEDARARSQALGRLLAPHFDQIIDDLYWKVTKAKISPHITPKSVERLKVKQKEHWRALFNTTFDQAYREGTARIGVKHRDIELDPLWYIAAYTFLKMEFTHVIVKANIPTVEKGHFIRTLDKYVAIDMGLTLLSFENTAFVD